MRSEPWVDPDSFCLRVEREDLRRMQSGKCGRRITRGTQRGGNMCCYRKEFGVRLCRCEGDSREKMLSKREKVLL